jgi:isocitrate/isopropylmalate dehydrogenase
MLQGGMGFAAGGNIDPERRYPSMFEPIHGSAPKYRGKGIACPVATIAAVGMMLDFLGNQRGAQMTERAIETALRERQITDLSARSGLSTSQYTDILLGNLR